uniref:C3H1-type domain-containing protein n=1 Tax=Panagrolaimus sp. PS1159 TaxID=55785 RepID=A0AC35FI51_9BILA
MNFYPSPFHPQQQQLHGQCQQQQGMMNPDFYNPFLSMLHQQTTFMAQQHHQQQQQNQRNTFQLPSFLPHQQPASTSLFDPASTIMMMAKGHPSPPQSFAVSSNGSVKEETPREVFFRTLSTLLKNANKRFSGKTTTWKNPFLYKTNLCVNYTRRLFCRFGVNCWYAHGTHELRCIPESDELPDPEFIIQYLSFLGLPNQYLQQIIHEAYQIASFHQSISNSPTSSKQSAPSHTSTTSLSLTNSPINNVLPTVTDPIASTPKSKPDKFYSSIASNGGWADIESALSDIIGNNLFGKSYEYFGTPQKP